MGTAIPVPPPWRGLRIFLRTVWLVHVSNKGWWARARQTDPVSSGDMWDTSLSCSRELHSVRLYPGGRVQNSSVKTWLLHIQTAFGKLRLYEFIQPDPSFRSGRVTACQVSAEDDGAYYDRQKHGHALQHTQERLLVCVSNRSKRKRFRLRTQCLLRPAGSSLAPLGPGSPTQWLLPNPAGEGGRREQKCTVAAGSPRQHRPPTPLRSGARGGNSPSREALGRSRTPGTPVSALDWPRCGQTTDNHALATNTVYISSKTYKQSNT